MDAAHEERIRVEVARRLSSASASLPTSALARASRIMVGMARAGTLSLERSILKGHRTGEGEIEAVTAIVASIGQLKGVTMKIGQVLSYIDVGIPDDLRAGLSVLQTRAQPEPFRRVKEMVEKELGEAGKALAAAMIPDPISTASIGQVHRSKLPDGTSVAVKVAYPGISDAIAHDFGPATLSSRLASWIYPGSQLETFVREVRARVLEESDYTLEAKRQAQFAELFAWHPLVAVPKVHEAFCSPHVLTTTFVEGKHLDAFLAGRPSADVANRLGEAMFEFYLGALFKHGLYNCDPHPGNYLFTAEGICFLDFGCTCTLEAGAVERIAALTRAVTADERPAIERALHDLGAVHGREPIDYESARGFLRAFYGPMLKDEVVPFDLGPGLAVRELLRRGKGVRGLTMPGELLFVLRTALGLSAVLSKLGARANWYGLLHGSLAAHAERLASQRGLPPPEPGSRPAPGRTTSREIPGVSRYQVVVVEPGENVIELIRFVRDLTGMSLRDVKDAIDRGPWTMKDGVAFKEADALRAKLQAAGAVVEVRPSP
jgi:predicted unusual protein kinase regulating ubiquinone biosynthesis (AarF/ABC1/UbiB family)